MIMTGRNLRGLRREEIRNLYVDALCFYNVETLKFRIIPSGFDLDKQNAQGKTLMHVYVDRLLPTHIKWLLFYGADKNIADHFGKVPLDYVNDYIDSFGQRMIEHKRMRKCKRMKLLLSKG